MRADTITAGSPDHAVRLARFGPPLRQDGGQVASRGAKVLGTHGCCGRVLRASGRSWSSGHAAGRIAAARSRKPNLYHLGRIGRLRF
jgi:hypothetical protein